MPSVARTDRAGAQSAIVLRQVREEDIDALGALRTDQNAQHLLLSHPEAANGGVREWLQRRTGDPDGYFAIVALASEDRAIGFVQLTGIHRIDRYAFAGIALLADARQRGAGRAAMSELIRFARGERDLRKLMLHVRADNLPALRLYEAIGFREVGVMREHYTDGKQRHDVVLLELILPSDAAR